MTSVLHPERGVDGRLDPGPAVVAPDGTCVRTTRREVLTTTAWALLGAAVLVAAAAALVALVDPDPLVAARALPALVAALSCGVAAVRHRAVDRTAWSLLGAAQLPLAVALVLGGLLTRDDTWSSGLDTGSSRSLLVGLLLLVATATQVVAVGLMLRARGARRLAMMGGYALTACTLLLTVAWAWGLPAVVRLPSERPAVVLALLGHVLVAVAGVALVGSVLTAWVGAGRVPVLVLWSLAAATGVQVWTLTSVVFGLWPLEVPVGVLAGAGSLLLAAAPWVPLEVGARSRPSPQSQTWMLLVLAVASAALLVAAGEAAADVWVLRGAALSLVVTVLLMTLRAREVWLLHRRLAESEQLFRTLVTDTTDVLLRLDSADRVVYASPSAGPVLGRAPATVRGRTWRQLVDPADADAAVTWLRTGEHGARLQVRVRHADGDAVWMEGVLSGRAHGRVLLSLRDIREQRRLGDELLRAATRDPLTGLLNRSAFEAELEQRLAGRRRREVAVLFCDLDGFKAVNDVAGHAAGDEVLVDVADRLRSVLLVDDVLARFGGDEFALLCADGTTRAQALALADRVVDALSSPFPLVGRTFTLSTSVGVAVSATGAAPRGPNGGGVSSALLRDADIAMYRAKASGRGQVVVFTEDMRLELLERLETASRVKVAIDQSGLQLRYQPQVDLRDGRVLGFEALVRWKGRDDTAVTPERVIAEAEATGQIVELGRQVLLGAVHDAAAWRRAGLEVGVSVNLSARQLDSPELLDDVRGALARSGLPPEVLTLEVTETMLPQNLVILDLLHALGVRLAVDDFGTGYAGLAQLRQIPADELKIDRTFLEGAGRVPERTSLLTSIARMGSDLGLDLVCEGVETLAQARLLRTLGVGAGQGFAFARAIPTGDVAGFVALGAFDLRHRPDADVPRPVPRYGAVLDLRALGTPVLDAETPGPEVDTPGRPGGP